MPPVTYHCSIAGRRQLLSGRHNQSLRSANTQGGGSWKRGEQTHKTAKAHSGGNALGETALREISVVKFLLIILQEAVLLPHCSTSHAGMCWAMLGCTGPCWAMLGCAGPGHRSWPRLHCCSCPSGAGGALTALLSLFTTIKYCEMPLLSCSVRSAALDNFPLRLLYPASLKSPAVSVI